ncbi:lipopolysaccharide heptosyltransferase II [Candidatus Poribacteria bacterium]|nr:lipopolysaccharide heptosyltransferase II [Candidatus Poribacteria bacterium]
MKNILLIRFGSLGDVVLTTPTIRAIRKEFPHARIAMLVGERSADVLTTNPHLDELITFERKARGLSETRRIVSVLKQYNFDVSIDMQRKFRSSLITYLGNVRLRIGYHEPKGFLCSVKIPEDENKHAIDRNLDLLKPLGIETEDIKPEIFILKEHQDFARDELEKLGANFEYPALGMFPGAGWRHRCWPAQKFAEVGDMAISNKNASVVVLGGPKESDILEDISNRMKNKPILMKANMTIPQLAGVIQQCNLFISNDTGPMHISVAVNTPTIGLFGPGNHIKFRPLGEQNTFIRHNTPCSPCKQFTDRCKDNICMKKISVDEVWEVVKEKL